MRHFALLLAWPSFVVHAATHVDDAGRSVTLPRPAARVITLAPSLTEMVFAVGGGASLVATVSSSDFPEAAKALPRIGDDQRLDVERIVMLKPDLLLAWHPRHTSRELTQLEATGLPVFYLDPKRLDDVPRALERTGALLGHEVQGRNAAIALRSRLGQLRQRYASAAPVTVFYQVWPAPLMTLSGQHLVSDVIDLCGGRNVFAELPQLVPILSTESVVVADAEVMISPREAPGDREGLKRDPQSPSFAIWTRHPGLKAVRRGWLYTLPGDEISRQGPRIVEGALALCAALDQVRSERAARP